MNEMCYMYDGSHIPRLVCTLGMRDSNDYERPHKKTDIYVLNHTLFTSEVIASMVSIITNKNYTGFITFRYLELY